ncbi:uncharacterized protein NECHADRAFT_76989 [Fusarium vanettenii 77-13-4]|uniref:Uncharacterized protein n=1 Tax=Fusarium vanettenii (strain ATCC MYA-4622 / CBS 123669 / FGSC 9596 / NRRL 45880 / 77-13-4) TaxID=660122 RepID=C7ZCB0_FUSV7|nr:uncharacterized protein NECHADRAFT_76989 [Fusarium vanettenii 77-13-4]EEU38227.1 predicted protein [Fusarium vanettenii 77-13-4]
MPHCARIRRREVAIATWPSGDQACSKASQGETALFDRSQLPGPRRLFIATAMSGREAICLPIGPKRPDQLGSLQATAPTTPRYAPATGTTVRSHQSEAGRRLSEESNIAAKSVDHHVGSRMNALETLSHNLRVSVSDRRISSKLMYIHSPSK